MIVGYARVSTDGQSSIAHRSAPSWPPTPEGDHFLFFAAISWRWIRRAGAPMCGQAFCETKLHMPPIGLSWPDMSLSLTRTIP
jgi:hypothetical protein